MASPLATTLLPSLPIATATRTLTKAGASILGVRLYHKTTSESAKRNFNTQTTQTSTTRRAVFPDASGANVMTKTEMHYTPNIGPPMAQPSPYGRTCAKNLGSAMRRWPQLSGLEVEECGYKWPVVPVHAKVTGNAVQAHEVLLVKMNV